MLSYLSKADRKSWGRGPPNNSDRLCVQERLRIKKLSNFISFYTQWKLNHKIGNNPLEEYGLMGPSYNIVTARLLTIIPRNIFKMRKLPISFSALTAFNCLQFHTTLSDSLDNPPPQNLDSYLTAPTNL